MEHQLKVMLLQLEHKYNMPEMSRYPNESPDQFMQRMMGRTMGKRTGKMTKAANRFMMTQAQKLQRENKQAEK